MSRHETIQQFDDGFLFSKNWVGHEKWVQIIVWFFEKKYLHKLQYDSFKILVKYLFCKK